MAGRPVYRNSGVGCFDDPEAEEGGGCDHMHTTPAAAGLCARKADKELADWTFGIVKMCGWELVVFDGKKQRPATKSEYNRYMRERTLSDEEAEL